MIMQDIVIVGAGGFGREVAWLIEDINNADRRWNIVGFVDTSTELQNKLINGYRVLGNIEWLRQQRFNVVVAVGNPNTKKKIIKLLENSKNNFPCLIHPNVKFSNTVKLGDGSIVCAGNIITVNIEIGRYVIVNIDCTIGHDALIGDYSTILPGAHISGNVTIGECADIGTGAVIIQGVNVGENTIVGAGSVVIRDLPASCTAVGSPAKVIKVREA